MKWSHIDSQFFKLHIGRGDVGVAAHPARVPEQINADWTQCIEFSYIYNPNVFVVTKGIMADYRSDGRVRLFRVGDGVYERSFSGRHNWMPALDDSEFVCMVPKDPLAWWDRTLHETSTGEQYQFGPHQEVKVIGIAKGGGNIVENGMSAETYQIVTLNPGSVMTIDITEPGFLIELTRNGSYTYY